MSNVWLEQDSNRLDVRKLHRAAGRIAPGQLTVLPTDTNYVFACRLGDNKAIEHMRRLRGLNDAHLLTLLLADFKSLGKYAVVDNMYFRLIKSLVPGPYTFILPATKEVPSAFAHKKRKTVGLRIPDNDVLRTFLQGVGEPMVSCSLKPPGMEMALENPGEKRDWLVKVAGLVLDIGAAQGDETTILDLSDSAGAAVVRQGRGPTGFLE